MIFGEVSGWETVNIKSGGKGQYLQAWRELSAG